MGQADTRRDTQIRRSAGASEAVVRPARGSDQIHQWTSGFPVEALLETEESPLVGEWGRPCRQKSQREKAWRSSAQLPLQRKESDDLQLGWQVQSHEVITEGPMLGWREAAVGLVCFVTRFQVGHWEDAGNGAPTMHRSFTKPCRDTASCNPATLLGGVVPILQTRKLKPVEVNSLP